MYQKDLVKKAWADAGLYRSRDPKLRRFLDKVDKCTGDCWPELAEEARERYAEYIDTLVEPLWKTGDKLVRLNLIRLADIENERDRHTVEEFVSKARPTEVHELQAIARVADLPLLEKVAKKRNLPTELRDFVEDRRSRLEREVSVVPVVYGG
jgi:hypothetical protein